MHSPGSLDDCNVFVKYLPHDLTDRDFYKMFKAFGTVVSSKIMVDQASGKSLGYGFANPSDSHNAISTMNGYRISNKRLLCKLANQSPSASFNPEFIKNPLLVNQTPSDNLYVKPLLLTTTEEDLRGFFSPFGTIVECKVMFDRYTGISRQIGFVRFSTVDEATNALEAMNTTKLDPSSPPLIVKYADTEEQKSARKSLRSQQAMDSLYNSLSPVYYFYPPASTSPSSTPYGFTFPTTNYGIQSFSPSTTDSDSPLIGTMPTPPLDAGGFVPPFGNPYEQYYNMYGDSSHLYYYGAEYQGEYGEYGEGEYVGEVGDGEGYEVFEGEYEGETEGEVITGSYDAVNDSKNGNGGANAGKPTSAPINIVH